MMIENRTRNVYFNLLLAVFLGYPFLKYALYEPWTLGYEGGDFSIYYTAAERISDGRSPYPLEEIAQHKEGESSPIWGEYPYPPLLARILAPLTRLSVFAAKWVYAGFSLILFFGLMAVVIRWRCRDWTSSWIAAAVLLGWGPFIYSIRLGQSELLSIPFLAAAWIFFIRANRVGSGDERHLEGTAGVFAGFAAMVRVTPVLMAPVFVIAQRWRLASGFAVGSVLALLLGGPISSYDFFTKVFPTMSDVSEMRHCPTIQALVLRSIDWAFSENPGTSWWEVNAGLIGAGFSLAVYLLVLVCIFMRGRSADGENLFLASCYLAPLLAGKNPHHYALALFPAIATSVLLARRPWILCIWVVVLLPTFNYWHPCKILTSGLVSLTGFSESTLFVLGNLAAFLLVLNVLIFKPELEAASPGSD